MKYLKVVVKEFSNNKVLDVSLYDYEIDLLPNENLFEVTDNVDLNVFPGILIYPKFTSWSNDNPTMGNNIVINYLSYPDFMNFLNTQKFICK